MNTQDNLNYGAAMVAGLRLTWEPTEAALDGFQLPAFGLRSECNGLVAVVVVIVIMMVVMVVIMVGRARGFCLRFL